MSSHKFKVGQTVRLPARPDDDSAASARRYVVTRLLPKDWVNFQYRIKDPHSGEERVVSEPELLV
jgi:hypothetical protein